MKPVILLLTILFTYGISFGQIEIVDKSEEPAIKAVAYNGEFMSFDGIYEKEKKAGVVGELVTLIDVSTYNIYESKEDLKSRKSVSYKLQDNFKNKTFEIVEYNYDFSDILIIKNELNTYVWKVSLTDKYVFNKYIDVVKQKYEGKTFNPLHMKSDFEGMDGSKFSIDGSMRYSITKVKFAKLKLKYGIVFVVNDSFECIYPNGSFDQPKLFNGTIYTSNDKYLNIASNDIFKTKVTLIEESEFNSFKSQNKSFLSKIRNREVQVGMTEQQCRWAWGIPSKSMKNIAGYDTVLVYGDIGKSQDLYFKSGKLELIK